MAPTVITALAKRQANRLTNYIYARAEHEYNEIALKAETSLWQSKDYVMNTAPVRVYNNVGTMFNNYKILKAMQAKIAAADTLSTVSQKIKTRSDDRGRIEKAKRVQVQSEQQRRRTLEAQLERTRRYVLAEQKRNTWVHTSSGLPCARIEGNIAEKGNTYSGTQKVRYRLSGTQPKPDYLALVRAAHAASENHEERHKHIMSSLDSIPRPATCASIGLASGHSGVAQDPFLAKFHYKQKVDAINDLHRNYRLQQRRQQEEFQRRAEAQEVERVRNLVIYEKACKVYDARVSKLAEFGSKLDSEITKLLTAFDSGNAEALAQAIMALINGVLEPANQIFEDMNKEIVLETMGADLLKAAWPVAKIDKVLETFNETNLSSFNDLYENHLRYMLRGIRTICQPILSAVPLVNPLNDAPSQPFVATTIPVSFETYSAATRRQQSPVPVPVPAAIAVPVPEGPNAGRNFSSFADLFKATKEQATAQSQSQVPDITLTPPTVVGDATPSGAASKSFADAAPLGSAANQPPLSNKSLVMVQYIKDNILEFDDNVNKLVMSHLVNTARRKEIEQVLQWLDDYAQGVTGVLPDDGDSGHGKRVVKQLIETLSTLRIRTEKNRPATKNALELARRVEKLWME